MKIKAAVLTIVALFSLATPAADAPAQPGNPGTKSILVNVMESAGKKPIQVFRVIAGVKSTLAGERGPEIINWQPHTLRIGRAGALIWPMARAYDSMALRVEADGYAPQVFAWLDKSKAHDVEFRLTGDKGTAGRVLSPEGKPAAGATVALAMVQREAVMDHEKTMTRADASFSFERVLPGLVQLSCPTPATPGNKSGIAEVNLPGMTTHLTVQPGMNPTLLGGQGRTVTGRLTGRASWTDVTFHFHPTAPHVGRPGDTEMWSAWSTLKKSPVGPVFFRDGLEVNLDGTFEINGVLPGSYQIFFTRAGEKEHLATGKFIVPAETAGAKPGPHSIGELSCRRSP